ncbi:hypothetical protein I7I53_01669 [Histoplasma capsulatum var. duboisii H88]|uniref:Uncharacterized protein n=1 Tax=Ajellomyces capsulatus (strain H88) TaxID=544711 RepID=A0A8A1LQE1_AJEC8|nr:hypothetical protein I7I53_01669 [Histoplasma capsulatum var. duboisii H88]
MIWLQLHSCLWILSSKNKELILNGVEVTRNGEWEDYLRVSGAIEIAERKKERKKERKRK